MNITFYLIFTLLLIIRIKQVLSLKKLLNSTERKLKIIQYNTTHNNLGTLVFFITMCTLLIATHELVASIFVDVNFILISIFVLLLFLNKLFEKYYCVNVFHNYLTYGLNIISLNSIERYTIDSQGSNESHLLSIFIFERRTVIEVFLSNQERNQFEMLFG